MEPIINTPLRFHLQYIPDIDHIFNSIQDWNIELVGALVALGKTIREQRGLNQTLPALRVGIIITVADMPSPNDVYLICQDIANKGEQYETIMHRGSFTNFKQLI